MTRDKKGSSIRVMTDIDRPGASDAFDRAEVMLAATKHELLGSEGLDRKILSGDALLAHDRLHAQSQPRPVGEVVAVMEDVERILVQSPIPFAPTKSGQFLQGEVDAMKDSMEFGIEIVIKPQSDLIQDLALAEANRIRIESGVDLTDIPESPYPHSYVDGRIVALEWVLGRRDTLDHRSDPKPNK